MSIAALPRLLTEKEVAEILNVSAGTLAVWRCTRRVRLPYTKVGHAVRYRTEDLERFIESRTVGGEGGEE